MSTGDLDQDWENLLRFFEDEEQLASMKRLQEAEGGSSELETGQDLDGMLGRRSPMDEQAQVRYQNQKDRFYQNPLQFRQVRHGKGPNQLPTRANRNQPRSFNSY